MPYKQNPAKASAKAELLASLQGEAAALDSVSHQLYDIIAIIEYVLGGSSTGCDARMRAYCEITKTQHLQRAMQHIERSRGLIEGLSVMEYEDEDEDDRPDHDSLEDAWSPDDFLDNHGKLSESRCKPNDDSNATGRRDRANNPRGGKGYSSL